MIITYQRPATLEAHQLDQLDQDAPDADLSPTGAKCGTTTVDVLGIPWSCSRAPHPGQDEHRAITPAGDGPTGAVAWTYQYATDEKHGDVDQAAPTQSITVTLSFPDRAAHGINAAAMIRSMIDAGLDHFWEGDQDDVNASSTATPVNEGLTVTGLAVRGTAPPHTPPPGEPGQGLPRTEPATPARRFRNALFFPW